MGQTHTFRKVQTRNWLGFLAVLFPLLLQAQVSVTFLQTNVSCAGQCDGFASAVGLGGTFPYTFVWSTGSTTASINNLCAGTYTVTATDANNNTGTGSVTIVQPNQLLVTVETQNQICGVAPDGTASAIPVGGTAPYAYLWNTGETTALITGLAEAVYTVTVTDFNGCVTVDSNAVFFWDEGLWLMDSVENTCFGASNGFAYVGVMTGTPPYAFEWSNGGTTQSITDLSPGTYTVTVVDVNGCSNTASATVDDYPQIIVDATATSPAGCTVGGSATVDVSGGVPPYLIVWNGTDTTINITNLPAGQHVVVVTDSVGCTASDTVQILQAPNPTVVASIQNAVTCISSGSAFATASGGVPPYSFAWSNGGATDTIAGLQPNTYTVTVTDSLGCTATASVTLTQPENPTATITGVVQATCTVGGSATVDVSGGIPPYLVVWNGTDTTISITNLPAGQHIVVVTDSIGCTASDTVQIVQPSNPTVVASIQNAVTCASSGSAFATASGGVPPYSFAWSNGGATDTIAGLQPNTYTVTVTDSLGCTATASVTLAQPENPTVTITGVVQATCITPGSAIADVSGGIPPYTFLWDNGETTDTATNLGPGQHIVLVTDAGGCSGADTVQILQPNVPTVTAQMLTKANCAGGGGSAEAMPSGGTPGYTIAWSSGHTTLIATNLAAGVYTVTVTDSLGCTATATVTILMVDPPTVSAGVTAAATCTTGGSVLATANGDNPPFSFLWSNGATTASVSNLPPGTYTVTVTDDASCTAVGSVTINPPPVPTANIIAFTDADCSQPGSATVEASGGTPPYTYLWDNGETTAQAVNLNPGVHTVTVTDSGGCTATATVTIMISNTGGVTIGDYVWYDNNQDGFQHPLDTNGVANVTVMLLTAGPDGKFNTPDDITVATTTTNNKGKYKFECVPPGTYVVIFGNIPQGYQFTGKDKVNNDCKDSDANKQGKTDPFTIQANQGDNLCVDAGIHTICINLTYAGVICCNQEICEGETPDLLYETVPPAGGSGNLEYLWMQFIQIGPAPPTWVAIPGATNADYQPGPLSETAYFMRCVRREGCETFLESNVVTITVLPAGSPDCPVFFTKFKVSAMSPSTVEVSWSTLPELSRYLYTVERSQDQQTWATVAERMGHEDASGPNDYAVMDHAPSNGMNYYRIKRRSASGLAVVSEIRQIEMTMSEKESMAIYPNPVSQILYIRNLIAYEADARVELFTADGQRLQAFKVPAGTLQSFEVPMAELPQGLYIVRVRFGDGNVKTLKIAKM